MWKQGHHGRDTTLGALLSETWWGQHDKIRKVEKTW